MLGHLAGLRCETDLTFSEKAVVSISYSFDGTLLAAASADCCAHIIDARSGEKKLSLGGEHSLGLNDCCWIDDNFLVTASDDNSIILWDVEMGKVVTVMHGHNSYVYCVSSNPMNRSVLSGGYDGSVMTFDVTSGLCTGAVNAHTEAVTSIRHSPQGNCFATGSEDGFVRIWDSVSNAGCVHSIYTETRSPISNVSYAPNGDHMMISSLDSCHRLYTCKNGNIKSTPDGPKYLKSFKSHVNSRYSMISSMSSFSKGDVTGSYLVGGSEDNHIYVWDLNGSDGRPVTLEGHTDVVLAVACHPDPSVTQIASASKDFSVKLWNFPAE